MVARHARQSAQGHPWPGAARRSGSRPPARWRNHPRIDVTDLEADLGTNYTYATIRYLVQRCPGVHFVWIMGADNLRHFHRWQRWRDIAALVPIAVVDRLGPSLYSAAGATGQRAGVGADSGNRGAEPAAATAAGLDLFAWPQIAAVVDGAARRARRAGALSDNSLKQRG